MAVLVAYATRQGTVRGVAERVAELLRDQDVEVDLRRLSGYESLAEYDAVVLGSAVYSGAWLEEAAKFAARNATGLAGCPVWTFSVGRLCDVAELRLPLPAQDHRFFVLTAFEREVFRSAGRRCGGFRDWPEIDMWAYAIAENVARPLILTGRGYW